MRTAWETFPIEFRGGLMTNVNPLQQGINFPGSATELKNFEPSVEGGYKKILGYTKWANFPVPGTGQITGAIFVDENDVMAVRGGVYSLSSDKADWVTKLTLGVYGTKVRHVPFNFDGTDKVVLVDGVNKPVIYNTVTQTAVVDSAAIADVQGASIVTVHKDRLFFATGPFLTFTAPFDESDYAPANGAGVINAGSTITGLVVFRGELIVFMNDQIKRLSGSSELDFQLSFISTKTGCLSPDSIQEVGGDIIYLGPDGIRYLSATEKNDDFALARASESIQSLVTQLFTGESLYASVVVREKAQYRLFKFQPNDSAGNSLGFLGTRFVDQQPQGIAWSELRGFKVYVADSKQYLDEEYIIFASDTAYVYQMESSFSFDGATIPCEFATPYLPITDPQVRKTFYKHTLYIKGSGNFFLNARMSFDYGQNKIQPSSWQIKQASGLLAFFGLGTFGGSSFGARLDSVFKDQVVGSAFTVSLRYSEDTVNPSFVLDTAVLEFRQNDRK